MSQELKDLIKNGFINLNFQQTKEINVNKVDNLEDYRDYFAKHFLSSKKIFECKFFLKKAGQSNLVWDRTKPQRLSQRRT